MLAGAEPLAHVQLYVRVDCELLFTHSLVFYVPKPKGRKVDGCRCQGGARLCVCVSCHATHRRRREKEEGGRESLPRNSCSRPYSSYHRRVEGSWCTRHCTNYLSGKKEKKKLRISKGLFFATHGISDLLARKSLVSSFHWGSSGG